MLNRYQESFTIFQTFMSGTDAEGKPAPYFGEYPVDYFDFIVIEECHRGGANYESNWRSILEYFSAAVQLGLSVTPKYQTLEYAKEILGNVANISRLFIEFQVHLYKQKVA